MLSQILNSNKYMNRDPSNNYHEEFQYINLINDVINHGSYEEGRNGKTKMIFGTIMEFTLTNNIIPILTTKRVAYKTCLRELYGL